MTIIMEKPVYIKDKRHFQRLYSNLYLNSDERKTFDSQSKITHQL